jgi:hypothetical protein
VRITIIREAPDQPMAEDTPNGLPRLSPLPYHDAIIGWLRAEEPEVWRWACSARAREEHANTVRAELLKETYRLDADAHPELHQRCRTAADRLGLQVPVTLYQSGDGAMNASLYYLPGEAHVVFAGPVLERLKGAELEAVLGHELAHHLLWALEGGAYHAADRVLDMAINDPRSSASQVQTARLFRLYTEVYADRGGAIACAGLHPAVSALVKTQTGLTEVSAASYLKQADEICVPGTLSTQAHSHPEVFVRSRALRLWCEADAAADAWLASMLQGPLSIGTLDLLGQQALTRLTRRVLAQLLQPAFMRSESMLAHARRFFPDFQPDAVRDQSLPPGVAAASGAHDYLAVLLMDFAVADRELDDVPLAAALETARWIGVADAFERLVLKELRMPKRQFNKIRQDAAALLQGAEQQHG